MPERTKNTTQVIVLDNGCMCCTVRGDLLGAFASVLSKMEQTEEDGTATRALDSVLVETTGMADPIPIVRTLLQVTTVFDRQSTSCPCLPKCQTLCRELIFFLVHFVRRKKGMQIKGVQGGKKSFGLEGAL